MRDVNDFYDSLYFRVGVPTGITVAATLVANYLAKKIVCYVGKGILYGTTSILRYFSDIKYCPENIIFFSKNPILTPDQLLEKKNITNTEQLIEQVKYQESYQIATKMLNDGLSVEKVHSCTGLTIEKVQEIVNNLSSAQ